MQLHVKRLPFLKAIQTADRAVPSRTTKDILKNVKLMSTGNQITLAATDSEIGLRVEVSDVIQCDGGEGLLPTSRMIQVLSELENDDDLRLEIGDSKVWIRGKSAEFQFVTEDHDGFPDVAKFKDKSFFEIKASDLRRLIRRTLFACDTESTRYALGGIQFEIAGGRAIFAATDSRRLAVDSAAVETIGNATAPASAPVIPLKAMKLLGTIVEEEGTVQIAFDKNGIAIKAGLVMLTSQFVQGRFPDWRKVMPSHSEVDLDLVVGPFFGAIRQAMIMRDKDNSAILFTLSKGQLRLKAEVADMGESKIDIPVGYEGEPITLKFDPKYFADVLRVLDCSSQLQLRILSPEDPALLQSQEYKVIVMPLSRD